MHERFKDPKENTMTEDPKGDSITENHKENSMTEPTLEFQYLLRHKILFLAFWWWHMIELVMGKTFHIRILFLEGPVSSHILSEIEAKEIFWWKLMSQSKNTLS